MMGCLKPIQIMYVPTVNTPLTKCPDLPYVDTDINEAKYELNIAIYYYGIMSVCYDSNISPTYRGRPVGLRMSNSV